MAASRTSRPSPRWAPTPHRARSASGRDEDAVEQGDDHVVARAVVPGQRPHGCCSQPSSATTVMPPARARGRARPAGTGRRRPGQGEQHQPGRDEALGRAGQDGEHGAHGAGSAHGGDEVGGERAHRASGEARRDDEEHHRCPREDQRCARVGQRPEVSQQGGQRAGRRRPRRRRRWGSRRPRRQS